MKRETIEHKLYLAILDAIQEGGIPEDVQQLSKILVNMFWQETPQFSFALREDIADDKRFLPTKSEPEATGYDVRAAFPDKKSLTVLPFQHIKIPLGFRSFCPDGWWYELKPRSSTFTKKNLHSLYGTIDQNYEGEAIMAAQYIPDMSYCFKKDNLVINFGDAIGQIIPIKRQEMIVVESSNEEYNNACKKRGGKRGEGGFGSTG